MSNHYLSPLFQPRSIAVIGASNRLETVGGVTFRNIVNGGFQGAIYAVNPAHDTVQGVRSYAGIEAIDTPVDLTVIVTPAEGVPEVVDACGRYGVRAAVIMSAGFREIGAQGVAREQRLMASARRYGLRFLGPNCFGLMRPDIGLNATFSRGAPLRGRLAVVSQSGALVAAILDWASANGVGFSSLISTGIGADIDFGEILDFLISDPETDGILLYVEGVNNARSFVSGLRAASRAKPITVIKSGRHTAGSRAAASHTGALVGADDVFEAALARAGVVRVLNFADIFSSAQILASGIRVAGDRLVVVTNGGGPGVMAMDRLADHRLTGATLSPATIEALNRALPATWSGHNPIDVIGDATPERYRRAVAACLADSAVDAVLVILTPQAMTAPEEVAEGIVALAEKQSKPLIACWMGENEVASARELFRAHRIPEYHTPEAAVDAFHVLAAHHRNQALVLQTPDPLSRGDAPDIEGATMIIEAVLGSGRKVLNEIESKAVLRAFEIPVTTTVRASDANEALLLAEEIGFPVAMKINSPDISHKSDVGGVRLNLRDAVAVRRSYEDMVERVTAARPEARIDGVTLQRMRRQRHTRELIVGVIRDPVFGPVMCFGGGGILVEALADRAVALPPLNRYLARELINGTRIARLLGQFRNLPPVPIAAIEDVLLRISELVCELPAVTELDINPLLVDEDGAIAVDARIIVDRPTAATEHYGHMAFHPYPRHLVERWAHPDGYEIVIRPIRPEDADIEERFVRALSRQSKYLRFMYTLKELSPAMLARFTQIDYDREMAFVAVIRERDGEREIGVVRYVVNPDGESCEFAAVVADEWQGKGVGTRLMTALMRTAASRKLKEMQGEVLSENAAMLRLLRGLGFDVRQAPDNPSVKAVSRNL